MGVVVVVVVVVLGFVFSLQVMRLAVKNSSQSDAASVLSNK